MKVIMASQKIEAKGLLSTIKDILNKLSDGWMKMIDRLGLDKNDSAVKLTNVKENSSTGGKEIYFTVDDGSNSGKPNEIKIVVQPQGGNPDNADADKWEVWSESSKNNPMYKNAKQTGTLDKCIQISDDWITVWKQAAGEALKKVKEEQQKSKANSSTSLKFAISRTPIKGSNEDSIDLQAINANYELGAAIEHMERITCSQSFLDLLPSDGQVYEIEVSQSPEGDLMPTIYEGFDKESFSTYDLMVELIKELWVMNANFKTISWNLKGRYSQSLLSWIEGMCWETDSELSFIASICHMIYGAVPNPVVLASEWTDEVIEPNADKCISYEDAYRCSHSMLDDYICILETVYVNYSDDIKQKLANMLFDMKANRDRLEKFENVDTGEAIPLAIQAPEALEV